MSVFLSLACRVMVNLESLNGVETVGNLVRHRTAPIVIGENGRYSIRFVPTISGESLAHAYQMDLVDEARRRGLPLSEESERGEFIKFTDEKFMKKYDVKIPENEDEIPRAESEIMLKDYVCDVGGFLYAGRYPVKRTSTRQEHPAKRRAGRIYAGSYPVKRTSTFQVGYMVPAIFDVEAAALEAQFHVRHAPSSMKSYQQPYNVEVGSAIYTFTFNLDVSRVAKPSTGFGKKDETLEESLEKLEKQRTERIMGALSALSSFITQLKFGAKRSRFLPNMEPLSTVAAVSTNVSFIVSPGNSKHFIEETATRKKNLEKLLEELRWGAEVQLFAMDRENAAEKVEGVKVSGTLEEFMKDVVAAVKGKLT